MSILSTEAHALEVLLGYRFQQQELLERALTHPSYANERGGRLPDNQRLEFLGDAVLGLLAAEYLFEHRPDGAEGVLTALRSQVASGKALAAVGERLGLGGFLRMGRGEDASGGRGRATNLADAVEALFAAAWLDGGVDAARMVFLHSVQPALAALDEDPWHGNPKGRLQELSQQRWQLDPVYTILAQEGPAHAPCFQVRVHVGEHGIAEGEGPSKRTAESEAARALLADLAG